MSKSQVTGTMCPQCSKPLSVGDGWLHKGCHAAWHANKNRHIHGTDASYNQRRDAEDHDNRPIDLDYDDENESPDEPGFDDRLVSGFGNIER